MVSDYKMQMRVFLSLANLLFIVDISLLGDRVHAILLNSELLGNNGY